MKTLSTTELMSLSEGELVPMIKSMSDHELETHIQALIIELGGDDYGFIMRTVMKSIEGNNGQTDLFKHVQNVLRDALPNKAIMSDIYQRVASMIMFFLLRRYKDILRSKD